MVSQACYTTSDGRRYSRPYPLYFPSPPERRFPLSSHDTRASIAMADQLDSDSTPQRKRIAVACGRCRKRKIRCSGDPGQGQPCTNCKNAGVDQCQFLRVSSREAPMRPEATDFGYSVGDARIYASRTPVGGGMPYGHEVPTLGSSGADVLGSYRGGGSATYAYTPASKAYYPAMHAYGTPYADEFEFGLGVASPSVLHQEPVGMMPGQWGPSGAAAATRASKAPSFSSMYMDAEGPYGGYGGAGMLHRPPHSVSSDSPSFSFSGVAASLPLSSTPGPDRLLPNPAGRASTLPYPTGALKPSSSSTSAASTLADVATAAASYAAGGFDTTSPGLSYSSTATTASSTSSLSSSHPSSSSRGSSDAYSAAAAAAGPESIFGEQERSNLQSQGAGFDLSSYTASPRRGSPPAAGAAGGGEGGAQSHHHHHAPSSQHHHLSASAGGYMGGAAAATGAGTAALSSSSSAHRHGHGVLSAAVTSGSGIHADERQVAVVSGRH